MASNLEKKQKKVDQQINEWKLKCDELSGELDKSQKDAREFSTEVLKLRSENEEVGDQYAALLKEHKKVSGKVAQVLDAPIL